MSLVEVGLPLIRHEREAVFSVTQPPVFASILPPPPRLRSHAHLQLLQPHTIPAPPPLQSPIRLLAVVGVPVEREELPLLEWRLLDGEF